MKFRETTRDLIQCVHCGERMEFCSRDQAQLAAFGRIDFECTTCNTQQRIEWQHSSLGMKLCHSTEQRIDSAREEVRPELPDPENSFEEGIGLDDPRPSKSWSPSPRQIAAWGPIVREETRQLKRDALSEKRSKQRPNDDFGSQFNFDDSE